MIACPTERWRLWQVAADPSRLMLAEQHGPWPKKGTGPCMTAGPPKCLLQHLPLSYDRRGRGRSFSLADELRTASDAQQSEQRGHS